MSRFQTPLSYPAEFDNDFDDIDYGSYYGLDPSDDYDLVRPISTAELQDEYPIGDIAPDSPPPDEIYHGGNRYLPMHSTNDYDVYELEQEASDEEDIEQEKPPFDDRTTHNDEYYWKEGTGKQKPETSDSPRILPPFTGQTTNNATYLPHVPTKSNPTKKTTEPRAKIPFHGKTSNQIEFIPKNTKKVGKQRPKTHLGTNPGNFEGATTSQVTYQKQNARPPTRYIANDHLGVGGQFFGNTTNAVDFVNHPRQERPMRRRQSAPALQSGPMESKTTNQRTYTPKKASTCPAEKLLLARKQNKLSGRQKNGHFFVPVTKNGIVRQKLTDIQNQNPVKKNANFLQKENYNNPKIEPKVSNMKNTKKSQYSPPQAVSPFADIEPVPTPNPSPKIPTPQNTLPKKRIAAPHRHQGTVVAGFPIA